MTKEFGYPSRAETESHIAEIAVLDVGEDGVAKGQVPRVRLGLKGERIIDGAAVMIHKGPDKSSEIIAYGMLRTNGHAKKNPNYFWLEPAEKDWYEKKEAHKKKVRDEIQWAKENFKPPDPWD